MADWNNLLAQLGDSLTDAAAEVERHEQVLASPLLHSDAGEDDRHEAWRKALRQFEERLLGFRQHITRAEARAGEFHTALAEHESQIREFLRRLDRMREKLANVPRPAVE